MQLGGLCGFAFAIAIFYEKSVADAIRGDCCMKRVCGFANTMMLRIPDVALSFIYITVAEIA